MKNLLILFIYSLIYSQNFIYNEDDWIIISNPGYITSMTVRFDEIMFTSNKGVFVYNSNTDDFSFMNEFIRGFGSDNKIIHNDNFRDHIWFLNNEKLYFKPQVSSIWREIDFYALNLMSSSNIKNIGSNHDFIFLKINTNEILVLDPYNGKKMNHEDIPFIDIETIIWSSTNYDESDTNFDLNRFKSDAGYNIISNDYMEYNGKFIYITCIIEDNNKNIWIGTDSGQLFRGNLYTDTLKKISNLPYFSNINFAYLDEYSEWWMSTDKNILMPDDIIMNTDNIFLAHWKEINNEWNYIKQNVSLNIKSSDITSLIRYGSNVYVGTNKGLLLYSIKKNEWSSYNEIDDDYYIYNLEKSNDYIYIATNKGIKIISIINDSILTYNNLDIFNNYQIYDLELMGDILYIASEIGLFSYHIYDNILKNISENVFFNITADNENSILYLNNKNRLFSYNENLKYLYSIKRIKDISFCKNFLWINNNRYTTLFNINSYENFEYDYLDGLAGKKINNIQCDDDWVSFATDKGLILYNWLKYHDVKK